MSVDSNDNTQGFDLGGTILSGIVGGAAGLTTQTALKVGGQKIIDMTGGLGTDWLQSISDLVRSKLNTPLQSGG